MGVHCDASCDYSTHGYHCGMGALCFNTRPCLTLMILVFSLWTVLNSFGRKVTYKKSGFGLWFSYHHCLIWTPLFRWFGLILLPIVSFSADAIISIGFFIRYVLRHYFGAPVPPSTLAKARAIDLSIQFTLFWMPFIVLLGWWIDKPMSLLFGRR